VRSLEVGVSVSVWWAPLPPQFLAPMARRMTPVLYERDRLLTFKAMVSEPGPYQGFLGMARFMAERDEQRLALLFAGAALEEALRMRYLKRVKPQDAAVLRDARRMVEALAAADALDGEAAAALPRWLDAIAQALQGDAPAQAASVAAAITAFVDARPL
jgi:hypothetical protein